MCKCVCINKDICVCKFCTLLCCVVLYCAVRTGICLTRLYRIVWYSIYITVSSWDAEMDGMHEIDGLGLGLVVFLLLPFPISKMDSSRYRTREAMPSY